MTRQNNTDFGVKHNLFQIPDLLYLICVHALSVSLRDHFVTHLFIYQMGGFFLGYYECIS